MNRWHPARLALILAALSSLAGAQPNAPAANDSIERKGSAPAAGAIVDETKPAAPAASVPGSPEKGSPEPGDRAAPPDKAGSAAAPSSDMPAPTRARPEKGQP